MMVLACVDGSRYTTAVCEYAARTANRLGVGVRVLHVLDTAVMPEESDAIGIAAESGVFRLETESIDDSRFRAALQQANAMLAAAVERVQIMGVNHVESSLVFGSLVEQLAELDAGTRLVVIGKRGEWESHATLHLGGNLERVVRGSRHPTLIVPPHLRPLRNFVVAFDGGSSSEKAIDFLTKETLLLEAECHVVMVTSQESGQQAKIEAAAGKLRAVGYAVTERLQIMEPGRHDEAIIAAVERAKADLLVMGGYGHSRIRNLLIGSTTTALLRASTIPVLVVR